MYLRLFIQRDPQNLISNFGYDNNHYHANIRFRQYQAIIAVHGIIRTRNEGRLIRSTLGENKQAQFLEYTPSRNGAPFTFYLDYRNGPSVELARNMERAPHLRSLRHMRNAQPYVVQFGELQRVVFIALRATEQDSLIIA